MAYKKHLTAERLDQLGYRPFFAGDSYTYSVDLQGSDPPGPLDLTGATVWFTVKSDSVKSDAEALLALKTGAGVTITDAPNGEFEVVFTPTDTEDIEGTWWYDLKVKLASGRTIRVSYGRIEFLPNITREN